MRPIQFFENFKIKLLKDVEISDEFDSSCEGAIIQKTKTGGRSERGSWKVWILKKRFPRLCQYDPWWQLLSHRPRQQSYLPRPH